MIEPLTIDLAILKPVLQRNNVPHLRINKKPVEVGEQVLMAGYPDDMELPLSFEKILDTTQPGIQLLKIELEKRKYYLLMIKSGMIGHQSQVNLTNGNLYVQGDVFYIDNQLHQGASGGPVVNRNGEIVGIIVQRAITSVPYRETPDLRVPSGSTVAISPRIIQPWIDDYEFNPTTSKVIT